MYTAPNKTGSGAPKSKNTNISSLKELYKQRVDDNVNSILENFEAIVGTTKVDKSTLLSDTTLTVQEKYEVSVRAQNLVKSSESLLELIAELKDLLIFQNFNSLNLAVDERNNKLSKLKQHTDVSIEKLSFEMNSHLHEMEKYFTP